MDTDQLINRTLVAEQVHQLEAAQQLETNIQNIRMRLEARAEELETNLLSNVAIDLAASLETKLIERLKEQVEGHWVSQAALVEARSAESGKGWEAKMDAAHRVRLEARAVELERTLEKRLDQKTGELRDDLERSACEQVKLDTSKLTTRVDALAETVEGLVRSQVSAHGPIAEREAEEEDGSENAAELRVQAAVAAMAGAVEGLAGSEMRVRALLESARDQQDKDRSRVDELANIVKVLAERVPSEGEEGAKQADHLGRTVEELVRSAARLEREREADRAQTDELARAVTELTHTVVKDLGTRLGQPEPSGPGSVNERNTSRPAETVRGLVRSHASAQSPDLETEADEEDGSENAAEARVQAAVAAMAGAVEGLAGSEMRVRALLESARDQQDEDRSRVEELAKVVKVLAKRVHVASEESRLHGEDKEGAKQANQLARTVEELVRSAASTERERESDRAQTDNLARTVKELMQLEVSVLSEIQQVEKLASAVAALEREGEALKSSAARAEALLGAVEEATTVERRRLTGLEGRLTGLEGAATESRETGERLRAEVEAALVEAHQGLRDADIAELKAEAAEGAAALKEALRSQLLLGQAEAEVNKEQAAAELSQLSQELRQQLGQELSQELSQQLSEELGQQLSEELSMQLSKLRADVTRQLSERDAAATALAEAEARAGEEQQSRRTVEATALAEVARVEAQQQDYRQTMAQLQQEVGELQAGQKALSATKMSLAPVMLEDKNVPSADLAQLRADVDRNARQLDTLGLSDTTAVTIPWLAAEVERARVAAEAGLKALSEQMLRSNQEVSQSDQRLTEAERLSKDVAQR
jgi:hypothetical protein